MQKPNNPSAKGDERSLDEYILQHIDAEGDYLHALWRDTQLRLSYGQMASGHLQGRVLKMLVEMAKPLKVLELGTFSGYATLCMAEGLQEGAEIHTFEVFDENEDFLRKWFEGSAYRDKITLHIGDALQLVPQPNHSLLLTVSARQEEAVPDFLKAFGEDLAGIVPQEEEIPTADQIVEQALSIPVVFRFESMKEVESFCAASKRTRGIESRLIKGEDGGIYMVINRKSCSESAFVSFIANILEYSDIYTSKELEIDYLLEHGSVLVEKNAVNTIKKYCV